MTNHQLIAKMTPAARERLYHHLGRAGLRNGGDTVTMETKLGAAVVSGEKFARCARQIADDTRGDLGAFIADRWGEDAGSRLVGAQAILFACGFVDE